MYEQVKQFSIKAIESVDVSYKRYFFKEVDFNEKLIGITGDRGIGKTTFLLPQTPTQVHTQLYPQISHHY